MFSIVVDLTFSVFNLHLFAFVHHTSISGMHDVGIRHEGNLEFSVLHALAEIDVLLIEEEVLIEAAQITKYIGTDQESTSADIIRIKDF